MLHPLVKAAFRAEALRPVLIPQGEKYGMASYKMDLTRDRFVHFTSSDRALQILASKKLMMNPPHEKFGGDAIYAISTVWGRWVPRTQTTHIKGNLVGVVFQTTDRPDYGHPEEVVWHHDVALKSPKVVSYNQGVALVKKAQGRPPESDNFVVTYR